MARQKESRPVETGKPGTDIPLAPGSDDNKTYREMSEDFSVSPPVRNQ